MFSVEIASLFGEFAGEADAEGLRGDMEKVGPEDAAKLFDRAEHVIEGYLVAAEDENRCLFTVLTDAQRRAREARRIAEGYVSVG